MQTSSSVRIIQVLEGQAAMKWGLKTVCGYISSTSDGSNIYKQNSAFPEQPSPYKWLILKELSLLFFLSCLLPLALWSHAHSIDK